MFGLTSLGTVHTAISLVALAAGLVALLRYGQISMRSASGKAYVWATVLTCLTASASSSTAASAHLTLWAC